MEREKHKPDEKGMKIYIDRGPGSAYNKIVLCKQKRGGGRYWAV